MPTEAGDTVVYGVEFGAKTSAHVFKDAVVHEHLLPNAVMLGKNNEDLLGIRIVGRGSLPLYESANWPKTPYVAALELTPHFGGLKVQTAVRPEYANQLVIGGLPRSRLPLLLGMGDGQQPNKMPFVGVYARFPQYRPRSATVEIIEDRINDCFERSMNGKALPRDSRPMRDIVAYLAFLSYGIPVGAPVEGQGLPRLDPLVGDTTRGRDVFTTSCVQCHGADGQGGRADTAVAIVGPPLWGPHSFNVGAGMIRTRLLNPAISCASSLATARES